MKFSLPFTPGISSVINKLSVEKINDIYFSDNKFGSARAISLTEQDLQELYLIRSTYGIKLHYLINGNYYSNESYEKVSEIVEHVAALDVDMVTLNNTYLMNDKQFMHALRSTDRKVEIKNSVNNRPQKVKDVMFFVEVLGITSIILDRSLNRNLDELNKIREYAKKKNVSLTMLVNEGCIVDCMWKNFDDMMIAQTKPDSNYQVISFVHNTLGCTSFFEKGPAEYLKTGFTLPNDLSKFDGLIDVIKLAGRGIPIDKWLNMCKSYLNADGNISLKMLFSTRPPGPLMNISANDLMSRGFNVLTSNCKNICGDECTKCDTVYEDLLTK